MWQDACSYLRQVNVVLLMRTILHEKKIAIKSTRQPSRKKSAIQILIYSLFVRQFKGDVDLFIRIYIAQANGLGYSLTQEKPRRGALRGWRK